MFVTSRSFPLFFPLLNSFHTNIGTGPAFGPWGALIGGGAGALLGGIGKLFGGGEIEKLNDMRDAFLQTQGGWEALQQALNSTDTKGVDLVKQIFDAKTVEQFNAAVALTQAALAGAAQTQAEANAITAEGEQVVQSAEAAGTSFAQTMTEGFAQVVAAITQVAGEIQALVAALTGIPNIDRTVTIHTEHVGGDPMGGAGDEFQGAPRFQRGIERVPRGPLAGGGLPAILDPGEAVLNRRQADQWRGGGGGSINSTIAPVFHMGAGGTDEKFKREVLAQLERSVRLGIGNLSHEIKRRGKAA